MRLMRIMSALPHLTARLPIIIEDHGEFSSNFHHSTARSTGTQPSNSVTECYVKRYVKCVCNRRSIAVGVRRTESRRNHSWSDNSRTGQHSACYYCSPVDIAVAHCLSPASRSSACKSSRFRGSERPQCG